MAFNKHRTLLVTVATYVAVNAVFAFFIPPIVDAHAAGNAAVLAQVTPGDVEGFVSIKMLLGVIGSLSIMLLGIIGYFLQRTLSGVESSVVVVGAKVETTAQEIRAHFNAELKALGDRVASVDEVNREARHEMVNKFQPVTIKLEVQNTKIDDHERRLVRAEERVAEHEIAIAATRAKKSP